MEQPPDDVEIEPDEQTDAFTVSVPIGLPYTPLGVGGLVFKLSE